MIHPLNCKEVTTRLALGDIKTYSFWERLMIRFHLAICWVCRKYERQMKIISMAFRSSIQDQKRQKDTSEFKERLQNHLRKIG